MKRLLLLAALLNPLWAAVTIDCGSPSDQFFAGGSPTFVITPGATGDLSIRFGGFSYKIPADPGPNVLTLFFRETGTVAGPNQRRFSVSINDSPALSNFDLFAVAGLNPIRRDFLVFPVDGFVNLSFTWTLKSAIVSSIQLAPLQPPGAFRILSESATLQADGSYTVGGPQANSGSTVYDLAVYRNGLRQRPDVDYQTAPRSGGGLTITAKWATADTVLVDYTIYFPVK